MTVALAGPRRIDRLAPQRSLADRRRARLVWTAIFLALCVHLMLALVILRPPSFLRAAPAPPPPPPQETTIDIQNDVPAEGDAPVGGKQQASRATPSANPATPPPAGQPPAASPDLPNANNGELAPPAPGPEQAPTPATPPGPAVQQQPAPPQPEPQTEADTPRISLSDAGDAGEQSGGSAITPAQPDPKQRNKLPRYPSTAALARQSGRVDMFVHVLPDGSAGQVVIANTSGSATLDAAALRAVHSWHFRPAQNHGAPVASDVPVSLNFVLHGGG